MLEIKFILVAGIAYVYDNFGMETNMNFASFAASSTTSAIITYSYDRMAELSKAPNTLQSPRLSGAAGRLTSPALFPPPSADNATYYYQIDGNKNVTELTDASGAVVAHYEYSPFGAVVTATGTYAEDNPFRFSSEYYDPESSLVYYNYRYYSPTLGRWLKPDPIDEQGGYNLYAMLENNVVNWIDNYGLAGNVTHGTKKCHKDDNCPLLVVKINLWIKNYAERQRELIIDKYNYKKINPTIYNNHILEAIKSKNHVINCTNILLKKIQNCECGAETRVPKFYPKPLPYPAPVSVSPLPWWAKGGKSVDNAIVVATDVAVVTAGLAGAGIVTVAGAPIVAASGVAVIRGAVTVGGL